jgi:hypothetical protein
MRRVELQGSRTGVKSQSLLEDSRLQEGKNIFK